MTHKKKTVFQNNIGTSMSALNFNGESGKTSSLHCLKMSISVFLHASNDFALMGSGIPTKVSLPPEPKECRRQARAGDEGGKKKKKSTPKKGK